MEIPGVEIPGEGASIQTWSAWWAMQLRVDVAPDSQVLNRLARTAEGRFVAPQDFVWSLNRGGQAQTFKTLTLEPWLKHGWDIELVKTT